MMKNKHTDKKKRHYHKDEILRSSSVFGLRPRSLQQSTRLTIKKVQWRRSQIFTTHSSRLNYNIFICDWSLYKEACEIIPRWFTMKVLGLFNLISTCSSRKTQLTQQWIIACILRNSTCTPRNTIGLSRNYITQIPQILAIGVCTHISGAHTSLIRAESLLFRCGVHTFSTKCVRTNI